MQTEDAVVEYMTTGAAARLLGYTDTRSIVRLIRLGEVIGHRTPGGHWRLERESVFAARDRFQSAERQAS